ncbi:MAG TPA: penicillin-binding protein 2 [Rhodanobacteraceae bacterium]|nr:penicillin-binding protein 2 [Rhodanobacteraceae bacterium]
MTAPIRPPLTPQVRRPPLPNARVRLYTVAVLLGLVVVVLAARAVDLQVLRKGFLQQQGDARALRTIQINVSRGTIFDRNGEPLAVSTPVESIWANPGELLQHTDRVPALAAALGADADELIERLQARRAREFAYLERQLSPAQAAKVMALDIPGVNQQREYKRFYPSGEVMAHVLGFTNIDDKGQEGLELAFNDWLTGTPGAKRVLKDARGHVVENVDLVTEPKPGQDLTISIDRRIQYLAYRELKSAVIDHGARGGSIVVMDVRSGEILAMVNQPSYNPNAIDGSRAAQRRNRALTDLVEPGSVMKPFTIAAALESGKWTPTSPVDTNPGWLPLSGYVIHDVHNHGLLDVTGVITKSSNVGAAKISMTLDNQHMYDVLRRFGFGARSGSGFTGEAAGVLPTPNEWTPLRKATISYGYGLSVTPLQLARAYAALGDAGVLHTPTFVKDGKTETDAVIDPAIAREVLDMMETVVSPEGTALKAAVANYTVAGKTGTSHIAADGGYSDRYVSTFVGIAPATQPRLVAVVVVDDPAGRTYYGGLVAAPLFSRVMSGALRLLDVAPDNVRHWYSGGPDAGHPIGANSPAPDYAPGQANYEEGGAQ